MVERSYQGVLILTKGFGKPYVSIYGIEENKEFDKAVEQGQTLEGATVLRRLWLEEPLEWSKGMSALARKLLREETSPR